MNFTSIATLLSAFGLSASAGLNAYIPLLIVGVVGRFAPGIVRLSAPFDGLTNWWAIGTLSVLVVIEILADKIPVVDHANDVLGTVIRPAAGAILFAATTGTVTYLNPTVALVLGLVVAGAAHGATATARPVVTATTGGIGNPIVSTIEDIAALFTSLIAVFVPIVIGIGAVMFGIIVLVWRSRRRSRSVQSGA